VRAIPWPSGRWRARRRIDTGHAGRLDGRERARGHVQLRCRGGKGVGRGKGCCLRHRSGSGPPASRDAHGRGRHSAAQRTYARRAGRPTQRTGGQVGPTAARSSRGGRSHDVPPLTAPLDGVSNHLPQQKPARRHHRLRVIVAGSNPGCRCARSPCATRGGGGGARAGAVRAQ